MKVLSEAEIVIINGGATGSGGDFEPPELKGWWEKWFGPWSNDGLDSSDS